MLIISILTLSATLRSAWLTGFEGSPLYKKWDIICLHSHGDPRLPRWLSSRCLQHLAWLHCQGLRRDILQCSMSFYSKRAYLCLQEQVTGGNEYVRHLRDIEVFNLIELNWSFWVGRIQRISESLFESTSDRKVNLWESRVLRKQAGADVLDYVCIYDLYYQIVKLKQARVWDKDELRCHWGRLSVEWSLGQRLKVMNVLGRRHHDYLRPYSLQLLLNRVKKVSEELLMGDKALGSIVFEVKVSIWDLVIVYIDEWSHQDYCMRGFFSDNW